MDQLITWILFPSTKSEFEHKSTNASCCIMNNAQTNSLSQTLWPAHRSAKMFKHYSVACFWLWIGKVTAEKNFHFQVMKTRNTWHSLSSQLLIRTDRLNTWLKRNSTWSGKKMTIGLKKYDEKLIEKIRKSQGIVYDT